MMKLIISMLLFAVAGCAQSPRATIMNNSPYWDMLYEGARFHMCGLIIGFGIWWWLRDHWKYQGTWKPVVAGAIVVASFSGWGLYRGAIYIHTPCTQIQETTRDCPAYKQKLWLKDMRWND